MHACQNICIKVNLPFNFSFLQALCSSSIFVFLSVVAWVITLEPVHQMVCFFSVNTASQPGLFMVGGCFPQ